MNPAEMPLGLHTMVFKLPFSGAKNHGVQLVQNLAKKLYIFLMYMLVCFNAHFECRVAKVPNLI